MRRTSHKGSQVVANVITWAQIREFADAFTGFSSRGGTMKIGPVWCAIGPTTRQAMMDSQVLHIVSGSMVPNDQAFTASDIRAIRQAFFEECEAQGIFVHDGEPFFRSA